MSSALRRFTTPRIWFEVTLTAVDSCVRVAGAVRSGQPSHELCDDCAL